MKSILVLSRSETTFLEITATFKTQYKVDHAISVNSALEIIKKKSHDFLFVDLEMLKGPVDNG
jgi:DNA-binding response OmpR family regulator